MDPLNLPALTSHVNDFSGVLTIEKRSEYDQFFKNHEQKTSEQVAVVLFPHRQGHELLDIGLKVFNENGLGDKSLNNGLLLIVATEEKKLRIVVGKGLELKYTEMKCRDIIENHLRPLLNAGKYDEMIQVWGEIVSGETEIKYAKNTNITDKIYQALILMIMPLIFCAFCWIVIKDAVTTNFLFYFLGIIAFAVGSILTSIFSDSDKITWKKLGISSIIPASIYIFATFFPLQCHEYEKQNKIYEECSRVIFSKTFIETREKGYTQEYKDANPELFQSYSSYDSDNGSSYSSYDSDSSWGGGSSNGGGWGD